MTGHALPFVILVNPGIGEASVVLEGLPLILALGVLGPHHNRNVRIRDDPNALIGDQASMVLGVQYRNFVMAGPLTPSACPPALPRLPR
jgi:hypothetical protein